MCMDFITQKSALKTTLQAANNQRQKKKKEKNQTSTEVKWLIHSWHLSLMPPFFITIIIRFTGLFKRSCKWSKESLMLAFPSLKEEQG